MGWGSLRVPTPADVLLSLDTPFRTFQWEYGLPVERFKISRPQGAGQLFKTSSISDHRQRGMLPVVRSRDLQMEIALRSRVTVRRAKGFGAERTSPEKLSSA